MFCNPPYGRYETGQWVKKAYQEHIENGTTIVMLLPARTDTQWFHNYIYGKAEVRFVRGRLKFEVCGVPIKDKNNRPMPAPFPSMVVVWRKKEMSYEL